MFRSSPARERSIPAWLRFLESRRLIDADTSKDVVAKLLPLLDQLLRMWKHFNDDPQLYRQGQAWQPSS